MTCTVGDVYRMLDALAPFDTAMEGDNAGLLVGRMDQPVDTILTALDATPGVVCEARERGAQLLVTHHPLLFEPIRSLNEGDLEAALLCSLVRANLSLIAAHTNLDLAPGGVNDALAARLGWPASRAEGYLRLGTFDAPRTLVSLRASVASELGGPVAAFGKPGRLVTRFAICSGAGSSEVAAAAQLGAEVFLTGEIKHSAALEAAARGMAVLAAGHRETEICAADLLARHLQSSADAVKYKVRVYVSAVDPFAE